MKRKELIKKLKPYWKDLIELSDEYYEAIDKLEIKMQQEIGIEDLEIFLCEGNLAGIGNYSRTLKLICQSELEDD